MKTLLLYGAFTTLANALLVLLLFFLGYQTDPTKFAAAQKVVPYVSMAIGIVGIILGTRARRSEVPLDEAFTYGRALGAGVLIGLFSALFGSIFQVIYQTMINPGMVDLVIESQLAGLEAQGMNSQQIEQAEKYTRIMFHPALQLVVGVIVGGLWGLLVSLISSAFLKRPALVQAPDAPVA